MGKIRRKIELALGIPVWASTREFMVLAAQAQRIGVDPVLSTKAEIAAHARQLGLPHFGMEKSHATLIAKLEAHFATQPTTRPQTTDHALVTV